MKNSSFISESSHTGYFVLVEYNVQDKNIIPSLSIYAAINGVLHMFAQTNILQLGYNCWYMHIAGIHMIYCKVASNILSSKVLLLDTNVLLYGYDQVGDNHISYQVTKTF